MASKVWETMNDLEMTTAKICSAREIIDAAIDRIQEHQYDKAETMMTAAYEFLEYYLNEFDEKFKLAWQETVVKQKKEEDDAWDAVNREKEYYEPSMPPWGHSDMEYGIHYKDEELNAMCDKAAAEEENKKSLSYADSIKQGWSMTADGFWIPPQKEDLSHLPPQQEYLGWKNVSNDEFDKMFSKDDKVVKWQLPVEVDSPNGEYFVTFPDDLLEAANLKEGDKIEWIDQGNGSYILKKLPTTF